MGLQLLPSEQLGKYTALVQFVLNAFTGRVHCTSNLDEGFAVVGAGTALVAKATCQANTDRCFGVTYANIDWGATDASMCTVPMHSRQNYNAVGMIHGRCGTSRCYKYLLPGF